MRARKYVSIPVWCDLEDLIELEDRPMPYSFNSSMVRFGGEKEIMNNQCHPSFNSSMVRFGAVDEILKLHLLSVSIPVWCDLELKPLLVMSRC